MVHDLDELVARMRLPVSVRFIPGGPRLPRRHDTFQVVDNSTGWEAYSFNPLHARVDYRRLRRRLMNEARQVA
jgi:hypothetical protein